MIRRIAFVSSLVSLASFAVAHAAPSASWPPPSSSPPPIAASSAPLPSAKDLPVGHPPLEGPPVSAPPLANDAQPLPEGHPPMPEEDVGNAEMPRIPRDDSSPDPSIPAGTILARILDANDRPVADVDVKLVETRQSVAQGDSKETLHATTDASGLVHFDHMPIGSAISYALSVTNAPPGAPSLVATYEIPFFILTPEQGHRVTLHRFPVSASLDRNMLVASGCELDIEIVEDSVHVRETLEFVNFGVTTWALADGIRLSLPKEFKALRSDDATSPHVIGEEGSGAKLVGAIRPGGVRIGFDFQLPYDGAATFDFEVGLPPRIASEEVRLASNREMSLTVDGLPPSRLDTALAGAHVLVARRSVEEIDPAHPPQSLSLHIKGLPSIGPYKWLVTLAGLGAVGAGFFFAFRRKTISPEDLAAARDRRRKALLADLLALDRAARTGEVGPKAHERERAKLIDALADVLDGEVDRDRRAAVAPKKRRNRRREAKAS